MHLSEALTTHLDSLGWNRVARPRRRRNLIDLLLAATSDTGFGVAVKTLGTWHRPRHEADGSPPVDRSRSVAR